MAEDQWDLPTCPGWTVRDLVTQVVDGERSVATLLGADPTAAAPGVNWFGNDLATAWEEAAHSALRAWKSPAGPGTPVQHPVLGSITAERLAQLRLVENAVHRWDLAQACGFGPAIDPALAASVLAFLPSLVADQGEAALFSSPLPFPPDADLDLWGVAAV